MNALLRKCLFFLLTLSIVAPLSAAPDPYAGEAPVADDGPAERAGALARVLGQVLVRVSGRPAVAGMPGAQAVIEAAPDLVQQFRYRVGEDGGRRLWARFDPAALERAMRAHGLPVWTGERPRLLLWMAAEDARGQRALLDVGGDPALAARLRAIARRLGMPLQLPLMDLRDRGALSAADLWSDYRAAIREASRRYPHGALLTGLLQPLAGGWQGVWTLETRGLEQRFRTRGETREAAIAAGLGEAWARLADHLSPATADAGETGGRSVRVEGVTTLESYAALLRDGLLPREARLREADGDVLVVVVPEPAFEALRARLDASPRMRPLPPSAEGGEAASYRYLEASE